MTGEVRVLLEGLPADITHVPSQFQVYVTHVPFHVGFTARTDKHSATKLALDSVRSGGD